MKAICVKDVSNRLTEGKEYELLDAGDGTYGLINDNGDLWWSYADLFRPVPDPVPEPVNEWMQVGKGVTIARFINMNAGYILAFSNVLRKAYLGKIGGEDGTEIQIETEYAEAFAQMVGYKWEE